MGCVDVHVDLRMLVGYLHREGDRKGESLALVFDDFDLPAEMVNLDKNKTDDPRSWRLSPGVARALSAYKALREAREGRPLTGKDTVFCIPVGPHGGHSLDAARVYRRSLLAAGVTRAQLHERNANRSPARLHDTRASFVTVAFANGKGDLWISDRTGHTTMTERKRYRRDARAFAESNLGDWRPLDGLIPELAPYLLVAEQAPVEQASVEQATEPALPCVSGVLDCAAGASGAPICDGEEAPTGVRHFPLEAIVEDSVDAASRSTLGATVINVVFQRDLPSRSDAKSFPTLGPPQSPEGTSFV